MITEATSLVLNNANDDNLCSCNYLQSTKSNPVYRWRNCDTNMNSYTPETQYQKQKIIQNTVRVASSLYTMNLGSLSGYENANKTTKNGVCWNQMSDRIHPHVQKNPTSSGSSYGGNSTKRSIFRLRPGAMSPGGKGVDIKHNSYERRLNRLKGQSVLRRGRIPKNFGAPIPFNPAFPVYGGKTIKTNIISGCNCPEDTNLAVESLLNVDPYPNDIYDVQYKYSPGQKVYVVQYDPSTGEQFYYNGIIVSEVDPNNYIILLENCTEKVYNILRIFPSIENDKYVPPLTNDVTTTDVFSDIANIVKNNANPNMKRALTTINSAIQNDINNLINSTFQNVDIPEY